MGVSSVSLGPKGATRKQSGYETVERSMSTERVATTSNIEFIDTVRKNHLNLQAELVVCHPAH